MFPNIKPGLFLEGANGPVLFQANVQVALVTDQREYQLEERSTLENNHMIGLYVTKPGTKLESGKTQASGSVFDSVHLTFRVGTTDIMRRVYLHQVQAANESGCPFEISLPEAINLRESKLEVMDEGNIAANTAIEFQAVYVKKLRR
ncbi:MAG: hypothetical protein ACI81P_003701 [Neolewinella sp.]|jgi:hypothetical protein